MNTILMTIAFSIFILGALFRNKNVVLHNRSIDTPKTTVSEEVLSENDNSENKKEVKGDPDAVSGDFSNNIEPSPTVKPYPTLVTVAPPKPSPVAVVETGILDKFIYPGSIITERTSKNILMISSADPKAISDWYKNKIKELHLSVTTSVFTQANDKYLIKLSGANGGFEVKIEVNKEGGGDARISVSVS